MTCRKMKGGLVHHAVLQQFLIFWLDLDLDILCLSQAGNLHQTHVELFLTFQLHPSPDMKIHIII